jgi:hypothetical protein
MSSLGPSGGAAGAIPVRNSPERVGEGEERAKGTTRDRLGAEFWVRRRRGRCTATRRCTRRRRWESRRGGSLGEQCVAQGASLDRGGDAWRVGRLGKQVARELAVDGNHGAGGGALMVTREREACCFIRGRARRFAQRHFTDTSAAWARHGGVRARSTAATTLGGRRGRHCRTMARTARGVSGMARRGGGHAVQSLCASRVEPVGPWRPCRAHGGVCAGGSARPGARRHAALWSAGCLKFFQVALFDRANLQKVEQKCARNFSKWPCLTEQISKKLNRSGPSSELQSCRSLDPLQLSQRAYGLFLNQLCTIWMPSCRFFWRQ